MIIAASCAVEDDPIPAPRPAPKATASAPASSTTLQSGIDTRTGPVSLETLPPVLHPTTQPTPFGTLGLPYLVPDGPTELAVLPGETLPWVRRSSGVAHLGTPDIGLQFAAPMAGLLRMAASEAGLWLLSTTPNQLSLQTYGFQGLQPALTVPLSAPPTALAAYRYEAWVATSDGGLTVVQEEGTRTWTGFGTTRALAVDADSVWIGSDRGLFRVRKSDGASASIAALPAPEALAIDGSGTLWISGPSSGFLKAGSQTVTPLGLTSPPRAMALASDRLWLGTESGLSYYSLNGEKQGDLALPIVPDALAVDAEDRLWACSAASGQCWSVWGR